jgi:hypothetical protein
MEYEESALIKKITLFSLLIVLYSAKSLVFAHTTIKDQMMEGVTLYTADTIAHGCAGGESSLKPKLPVIAQSIAFPNGPNAIVTRSDTNEAVNLGDVLVGGQHSNGIINPAAIQDHNVFDTIEQLTDQTGVVRGIHYTNSNPDAELQVDLTGVIPFKMTGVTFVQQSCATQVMARIGIVDWCTHRPGERRNNLWFGNTTPVFSDVNRVPAGFWPVLIINRNLTTNPLPESCGEGYTVAIQPSDDDLDQYLPIPGFIP